MTLDEAIKQYAGVVESVENHISHLNPKYADTYKYYAENNRQLVEWLKELKELREQQPKIPLEYDNYADGNDESITELERLLSQDDCCLVSVASIKKALEQKPPCDDAVSRADGIKKVSEILKGVSVEYVPIVQKAIGTLPPVQPQPMRPKGHWIYDKETDKAKCSECNGLCFADNLGRIETPFCPWCGADMCVAKMVEPQESEDKE